MLRGSSSESIRRCPRCRAPIAQAEDGGCNRMSCALELHFLRAGGPPGAGLPLRGGAPRSAGERAGRGPGAPGRGRGAPGGAGPKGKACRSPRASPSPPPTLAAPPRSPRPRPAPRRRRRRRRRRATGGQPGRRSDGGTDGGLPRALASAPFAAQSQPFGTAFQVLQHNDDPAENTVLKLTLKSVRKKESHLVSASMLKESRERKEGDREQRARKDIDPQKRGVWEGASAHPSSPRKKTVMLILQLHPLLHWVLVSGAAESKLAPSSI
ncbi:translation initiation factor IF-2-like isoform X2 [Sceloporus undulatus]|uniref:translation initiation factor IF-2-like isoform X2 n=1 Tax=Sceloporus undulatus TaxID=8520 RepID=UPI001C4B5A0C|nr:translation initiation factor IF-2-like isoform X2 [Sceloporus undulatus]